MAAFNIGKVVQLQSAGCDNYLLFALDEYGYIYRKDVRYTNGQIMDKGWERMEEPMIHNIK